MRTTKVVFVFTILAACVLLGVVGQANASVVGADAATGAAVVDVATARHVALYYVASYTRLINSWAGATVTGDPVMYHSRDDRVSAYEFTVMKAGAEAGYIVVSARKNWMPVLEFGSGGAPSSSAEPARREAVAEGYISSCADVEPTLYYRGGGSYGARFGARRDGDGAVIDLVDGTPWSKSDGSDDAQLQMDCASAREEWAAVLGKIGFSSDNSEWHEWVVPIEGVTPKDATPAVPVWWQATDPSDPSLILSAEGGGDKGGATGDAGEYPAYVGWSDDPWLAWDGCSTITGAMILAFWEACGYTNFPHEYGDGSARETLIDLCHRAMDTDYQGNSSFLATTDGIHDVAAMDDDYYHFGYDFYTDTYVHVDWNDITREIDNNRPFALMIYDQNKVVLNDEQVDQIYEVDGALHYTDEHGSHVVYWDIPIDEYYYLQTLSHTMAGVGYVEEGENQFIHVNCCWDRRLRDENGDPVKDPDTGDDVTSNQYIQFGNWAFAAETVVIPQNALALDVLGEGTATASPDQNMRDPIFEDKYDFGTELTLAATPADGWYFAGWKGDTETIADIYAAETTITMEQDYEVAASFRRIAPVTPPALRLTFNDYDDVSPEVFGDRVVWSGYDGSDNEVYTWTPGGGTDQVTNNGYDDFDPQISGDRIVWSCHDGSDCEVFTWTLAGGVVRLTDNDGVDDQRPQVSGDRVVWEASEVENGGGGGEVMMAASVPLEAQSDGEDLGILSWTPTGGTTQIAQSDGQASPRVSGHRIVWSGYDGSDYEIFTWTPGGGTRQITDNDSIDDFNAQVSGDRVVWETWGAVSADFTWTPADGITQLPQSQSMPSYPQVSGDRVVWQQCTGAWNEWDIFTWTPAEGVARLTYAGSSNENPRVSGDRVVWQRYDGSDWQVCTWTPAEGVRQLTNGHLEEQQPMVPGCYNPRVSGDRVVWYGWWDDLDTEIYTAVFDTDRDTDGDGLPDYWELTGDIDGDGESDLDLPAMGADPLHKDVFVEIDWLESPKVWFIPARDHEPKASALKLVVEAFADAPVENPDGSTGITLHIDAGPGSPMDGETPWGSYSRAEAISVPLAGTLGTGYNNSYDWDPFDTFKEAEFDAERAEIFHYCIFAHTLPGNMTGISRGEADGASDFIVADGARGGESLTVLQQSGTFMHELGHNLGLRHGGGDPVNCKPNYLSVMNYAFQLTGLLQTNGMSAALDYSRYELFSLDENGLNETTGLTPPAGLEGRLGTRLLTVYRANGLNRYWYDGPADWDGDGTIEVGVQADINSDGDYSMLSGYDDWASLRFNGGWVGQAGVALPETTPADEISYEQFVALGFDHGPYAVRLGGSQIAQVCPGWQGHVPLTIENYGDMDDSYDVEVVSSSALVNVTGIPQTVSLAAGEQSELLLGLDVPLSQPDGHMATVRVVVTSRSDTGNVDECTMTIESAKPTLADSLSVLDQVAVALRAYAAETPVVSSLVTTAAEEVEAARAGLAESPVDRGLAVTALHGAVVSLKQSVEQLALADSQSGTPTYAGTIEDLSNSSTLLLWVARNEAEEAITEAEAAGTPAGAIAVARSHLGDGDEAFAQGDHVAAATEYMNAANPTSNQAPEVEISLPAAACEGSAFSGSGYFTDLDSTSWTATIDYGDSFGVQLLTLTDDRTYAFVHTYEDNGVYSLTVHVTDGEGGTGTATSTVTIDNVSPAIGTVVLPADPQALNAAVTAEVTFTDPGILDTHTATWDWGDGTISTGTVAESGGSGSATGTHAYDVPGFYAVSVTVIDKDGAGSTGLAQNVQILGVVLYAGGDATLSGSCRVGTPLVSGRASAAAYVGGALTVRGSADVSRAALYVHASGATVPPLAQFMPEAYVASLVLASQAAQATGTSYNGLKLSGAGSVSYAGAITVNGDLAISGSGTYSFDSVYVTGNVSISGSATVSFGSLYVGGTLKVSDGAATHWGPTYVAGNTTLSGSGQWNGSLLVTSGALTVAGSVTLGGDGAGAHAKPVRILVIGAGKPVTFSGSGTLYGLLYDQAGSVTQSGSTTVYGSVLCGGSYTASGSGGIEYDQGVLDSLE